MYATSALFVVLFAIPTSFTFECPSVCKCYLTEDDTFYINCSQGRQLTPEILQNGKVISRRKDGEIERAQQDRSILNTSHTLLEEDELSAFYLLPFLEVYLERIDMCCSNISIVHDDAFKYAGDVGHLDLSQNLLTEVTFIKDLHLLETLDVSGNRIAMVSMTDVKRLNNLKVLRLRDNRLISLSFMLMSLPSLTHLDVSDNFLKSLLPKIFQNKTHLEEISIAENKIRMLSYCQMLPLLGEESKLALVNLTFNPMTCDCHMVWISHTTAQVVHSVCAEPPSWKSTRDVTQFCSNSSKPICNTSNGTQNDLPWNPYATIPAEKTGARKAKGETFTTGPGKYTEAKVTQILVLAAIGCVAFVAVAVAVKKNRSLLHGKLNLMRPSSSTQLADADLKSPIGDDAELTVLNRHHSAEHAAYELPLPGRSSDGLALSGSDREGRASRYRTQKTTM